MASKVDICNKALTLMGANPITNLEEDSNEANILNRVYPTSLKSALSECKWNFATTRSTLASLSDTLAWKYDEEAYVYQRPSNCVRIFGVSDSQAVWREEGDVIISDSSGLGVLYVFLHEDPTKYPAKFIDALATRLAADSCYMITNSKSKTDDLRAQYETVDLPAAISENSQVGTQQTPQDDAWTDAKNNDGALNA